MTWEGSSSAAQATIEHTPLYVSAAAAGLGSPPTPTPYHRILKVPSISAQIYSPCESPGRGCNDDQRLQRSVAQSKSACHPAQVHPAIPDCLLGCFAEKWRTCERSPCQSRAPGTPGDLGRLATHSAALTNRPDGDGREASQ